MSVEIRSSLLSVLLLPRLAVVRTVLVLLAVDARNGRSSGTVTVGQFPFHRFWFRGSSSRVVV